MPLINNEKYSLLYQRINLIYQKPEIKASLEVILSVFTVTVLIFAAIRPTLTNIASLQKKIEDLNTFNIKADNKIAQVFNAQTQLNTYRDKLRLFDEAVPDNFSYYDMAGRGYEVMLKTADQAAPSFEEKAFHDFHMYTLDQPVTFADKQTKQLELYPLQNITASQFYEYNTFASSVLSIIKFKNTEANGIGKPLPKGTIKVYKKDVDNNLEFIGEDSINHTSKNEEVRINTGSAFDLVGKTIVKDRKTISQYISQRTIQVTLRNNSNENKSIDVIHNLGTNAKIISVENVTQPTVDEYNNATFKINIAPNQEIILSFLERTEY